MRILTHHLALRAAVAAAALVVGPAALAPGTAEAPTSTHAAQRAGDGATAGQKFAWRAMLWDYAWEFGESLDSRAYRGTSRGGGEWEEYTDGSGRVVKYGGGVEFHSGVIRNKLDAPDHGTTMLTLHDKGLQQGRWEIKERSERSADLTPGKDYRFVIELVPEDGSDACANNIRIAEISPGNGTVTIGAKSAGGSWARTVSGYPQSTSNGYAYGLEITGKRITWFLNGQVIGSLGASAARPKVPMTVRMRLVGADRQVEMNKSVVKIDWVRGYNLKRGKVPPTTPAVRTGSYAC
jgi:hypothetical protein